MIKMKKSRQFSKEKQRDFYIVFIRPSRSCFCSSDSVLHFEKSNCCSSVKAFGSLSSEKNCAKVIPNTLQTASKVGSVGALFLLNIFVTVEWEKLASFASR